MAFADKAKNTLKGVQQAVAEATTSLGEGLLAYTARVRPESVIDHSLAIEPMPHQLVIGEAVRAGHTRLLIADDMGVGKTYSALLAIDEAQAYPALLVCPPALVINWERSIKTALPSRSVATISGKKPTAVPSADIVIIPDSVVGDWALAPKDVAKAWEKGGKKGARPVGILAQHPWRGIVQDEAHRSKSGDAQRTKGVLTVAKSAGQDTLVLLLTGTPMVNRPKELIPLLNILGHLPRFGGTARFLSRYCDPQFNGWGTTYDGATNVGELNDLLRKWVMIRRKRDEVISLPDFRRYSTVVSLGGKALGDYKSAVRDLQDFLRSKRDDETLTINDRAHAIVLLGQLRQVAGLGKVDTAVEQALELLANGEQVFLVTYHKEVAWRIREALINNGVNPREIVSVTGDDTQKQKQQAVDQFQAGQAKVLVGNVVAVSEGLTLTSCANMITVELPWTPSALKQAEARIDRYTQTRKTANNILVSVIAGDASVDERVLGMLERKAGVIGSALDGEAEQLLAGSAMDELLDSYR